MNLWKLIVRMLAIGFTWALIGCLLSLILEITGFIVVDEFQQGMRAFLIAFLIVFTSFLFALEKHG